MFMAKMSPKTVVASSKETPWSLRLAAAFFGSHSKLYATWSSYRRLGSFRELIGITPELQPRRSDYASAAGCKRLLCRSSSGSSTIGRLTAEARQQPRRLPRIVTTI